MGEVFTKSFRVGKYTVEMEFTMAHANEKARLDFHWRPDIPKRLTKDEMTEYLLQRNRALGEIAAAYDLKIGIIG